MSDEETTIRTAEQLGEESKFVLQVFGTVSVSVMFVEEVLIYMCTCN